MEAPSDAGDLHHGDECQEPLIVLLEAVSCGHFLFSLLLDHYSTLKALADGNESRLCHNNHTQMISSVDSNTSAQLGEIFPEVYDPDPL